MADQVLGASMLVLVLQPVSMTVLLPTALPTLWSMATSVPASVFRGAEHGDQTLCSMYAPMKWGVDGEQPNHGDQVRCSDDRRRLRPRPYKRSEGLNFIVLVEHAASGKRRRSTRGGRSGTPVAGVGSRGLARRYPAAQWRARRKKSRRIQGKTTLCR